MKSSKDKLALVRERVEVPELPKFTPDPATVALRDAMLLKAADVTEIRSAVANCEAADIGKEIRQHIKLTVATGLELRRPFNAKADEIKAIEDAHVAPLKAALARLEALGTAWVLAERRRVEDEEKARQQEILRLEKERLEAEAKLRQEAPAIAPAGQPDNEAAWEREQEAKRALEAAEAAKRAAIVAPMPEVQRARGQAVRQKLCFEVLDPHAVYAARPELCEVTVKPSAVLATCDPKYPIPGLRLWFEDRANYTTR